MTRKDYVAVAATLRDEYAEARRLRDQDHEVFASQVVLATLDRVTKDLADMFAADNSRFDRLRFYDAAAGGYRSAGSRSGSRLA